MSSVFIVFIGAFWPIFINTLNGVFAGIIFIGAVVSGIMFFVEMLERYLLRWRKGNG
jgi:ABC-type nitrate/sulfonate/bicarbonate transport system permease component